jgi:hypothetical protein
MSLVAACLWGLLGASAVEALDLYKAIRRVKGYPWRHPDEVPLGPYLLSVVIRVALGVLAAAVCAASSQIGGPAGALAAGYAAPKLFEQLARLSISQRDPDYRTQDGESPKKDADHRESLPVPPVGADDSDAVHPDRGSHDAAH